jgi:STE24 endopeptidase
VLEDYRAGRLSESQILAVLVHELGNHATGATRPMLIAMWFRAPWRVTAGLLTGLAGSLSRRPSQRTMQMMLFLGITVALVRALHHGYWMVGGVLAALALSTVICPLADAAVAGVRSSLLTRSLPTTVELSSWSPHSGPWMSRRAPPPDAPGGCWHPTRLPTNGSARF